MHTNVWIKTRIQNRIQKRMTKTRIQMYEKNAYKCMKKTRLQKSIKMYDKNTHTNV